MSVQIWIGAEDKVPRLARAVFHKDPLRLRHEVELSNWKVGGSVPAGAFKSARAASAKSMPFAHPVPAPPAAAPIPPAAEPSNTR